MKIPFFGVIINLFLVVMTIIRCCTKENYLGVIYLGFLYCFRQEWDLKKKNLIF